MNATRPLFAHASPGKWRHLGLLTLVELFAIGLWFGASAVVPQLTLQWHLTPAEQAGMTMSVQIGFVVGALGSAMLNLADRMDLPRLIALSTTVAALANAAIVLFDAGPGWTLLFRFMTGAALAGVYAPGMKLVATWCKVDRGFGIGLLVGALTVGTAMPHLLNALPLFGEDGMPPWPNVLAAGSMIALAGAVIAALWLRPGPFATAAAPFDWRYAGRALAHKPTRLANFGYLGHMWELYAMWAWLPIFLMLAYEQAGWSVQAARLAAFAAIAVGGVACVLAGVLADRIGRTTVTIASLTVSGTCCLLVGLFFHSPAMLTVICLIWGFAVIADSAQFSAAVSELTDPRYVGTALTVQTALGFLLTLVTIHTLPVAAAAVGWQYAFIVLAAGPVWGIWSMVRLRGLPEAEQLASGNR